MSAQIHQKPPSNFRAIYAAEDGVRKYIGLKADLNLRSALRPEPFNWRTICAFAHLVRRAHP